MGGGKFRRRPTKSFTLSPEAIRKIEEFAVDSGLNMSQALEVLVSWGYDVYLKRKAVSGKASSSVSDLEKRYWERVFGRDDFWIQV